MRIIDQPKYPLTETVLVGSLKMKVLSLQRVGDFVGKNSVLALKQKTILILFPKKKRKNK